MGVRFGGPENVRGKRVGGKFGWRAGRRWGCGTTHDPPPISFAEDYRSVNKMHALKRPVPRNLSLSKGGGDRPEPWGGPEGGA
jgi:hypothetical protein